MSAEIGQLDRDRLQQHTRDRRSLWQRYRRAQQVWPALTRPTRGLLVEGLRLAARSLPSPVLPRLRNRWTATIDSTAGSSGGRQLDVAMLIAALGCCTGVWHDATTRAQCGRMRPRALPCSPHGPTVSSHQDTRRVSHHGRLYVSLTPGLVCSLCTLVRGARIEHKLRPGVG